MTDRYTLISADTHAGADIPGYKPYLAAEYHDAFDDWAATFENPFTDISVDPERYRNWDSDRRLSELESEGVAAEVVFPNTIPPFFDIMSLAALPPTKETYPERWAGLQAHNRWLLDFCDQALGRRAGVIQVFAHRIEDAVAEVQWAAEHFRPFGGVLFPTIPPDFGLPQIWEAHYEPLWQLCEELGVPIHFHGGNGLPDYGDSDGSHFASQTGNLILLLEIAWFSRRAVVHMIFSGVFERHPGLKVALVEQGIGWVPHVMETLDASFRRFALPDGTSMFSRGGLGNLSMPPSEYFRRNVWNGSFLRPSEAPLYRQLDLVDRVMWGSDYPHAEGTPPYTTEALRAAFAGCPARDVEAIVFSNAAELYGFDVRALRAIGDRIGPRVDEVARPLEAYPAGATGWSFETEPAHTAL